MHKYEKIATVWDIKAERWQQEKKIELTILTMFILTAIIMGHFDKLWQEILIIFGIIFTVSLGVRRREEKRKQKKEMQLGW